MSAPLTRVLRLAAVVLAACVVAPPPAGAQQTARPFRKTDLVRMLTSGGMATRDVAALIRRSCLSFTPSARDLQDLRAAGADNIVMSAVDGCVRERGRAAPRQPPRERTGRRETAATESPEPAASPPAPASQVMQPSGPVPSEARVAPPVTPPAALPPATAAAPAAAGRPPQPAAAEPVRGGGLDPVRSGFIAGRGQRVGAGAGAAERLVVELRDSTGAPLPRAVVSFEATNGHVSPDTARTDLEGRVVVAMVAGDRAGPALVTARAGGQSWTATLVVEAGPLATIVVQRDTSVLAGALTVTDTAAMTWRVMGRDRHGNLAALPFLRVQEVDARAVTVELVEPADSGWVVRVRPRRSGRADVALTAGTVRRLVTVVVALPLRQRWSAGFRTDYVGFDYVWPNRSYVRAHGGPAIEARIQRYLGYGLAAGVGVTVGMLGADTVPTPSILVALMQSFVRVEYAPLREGAVSPVLALSGGAYRLRGDAKGEYVLHTALYYGIGGGVDVRVGRRILLELRAFRQHHMDFLEGHIANLTPAGAGLRFVF